jgi:hypothetical protein
MSKIDCNARDGVHRLQTLCRVDWNAMIVVIDDGFKFWVYKVWLIKVSKHFASLLSSGAEGLRASDPL